MFILKRTYERELNNMKSKLGIARDAHRVDQETNRAIIMDLGRQVDTLNKTNEHKLVQITDLKEMVSNLNDDKFNLNQELNNMHKQKQACVEECLKKDRELEEIKKQFRETYLKD